MRIQVLATATLLLCISQIDALRCFVCVNAARKEDCIWKTQTCEVDQQMCYTEIRNFGNRVSITKSCYQAQACATLASQNSHECPRVCSLCCEGNLCNKKGPDSCRCNLVSLSQLPTTTTPRTTRRKRIKPTRRIPVRTTTAKVTTTTTTTEKAKTCEESSFLPIPDTARYMTCNGIGVVGSKICSFSTAQVLHEESLEYFYLGIAETDTSSTTYHQCKYGMGGVGLPGSHKDVNDTNRPIDLICINMTIATIPDTALMNVKKHSKKTDEEIPEKEYDCVVDDLSVLTMFNESMLLDYGSAEYTDSREMENLKTIMELKKICHERVFSVQCYVRDVPTTTVFVTTVEMTTHMNETTTFIASTAQVTTKNVETSALPAATAKIQAAVVPTWGVSVIAVGGALLALFLVVILLRQCGKSGFYRVHFRKKKKVSPKHAVNA